MNFSLSENATDPKLRLAFFRLVVLALRVLSAPSAKTNPLKDGIADCIPQTVPSMTGLCKSTHMEAKIPVI
jgi:hypothetical protein